MNISINGKKAVMDSSKKIVILEANPPSEVFRGKSAHASWFINLLSSFDKNFNIDVYQVFKDEFPKILSDIAGIIVTGSTKEVYDKDAWIRKTERLIKRGRRFNIPILGVCFGHQLIAQAFGGKVGKNPKGREIGTCRIFLVNEAGKDELFQNLPKTFLVQESHISIVNILPRGSKELAINEYGNQAFRYGSEKIWGVQFHPEVTPRILKMVIKFRRDLISSEGLDADLIYKKIRTTSLDKKILYNFLKVVNENRKG